MKTNLPFAPVIIFLLLSTVFTANAQPLRVDFRQAANDDSQFTLGEVRWRQSILQQNNSVYYEGMSVPQRIFFTNIASTRGNEHSLTFSHKATKSGRHAYDFLTSYDQATLSAIAIVGPTILHDLNPCGADIGPPKSMEQSCTSVRNGPHAYPVIMPDDMGSLLGHSITGSIKAYEARFRNRELMIYGDKAISSATLTFNGYTTGSDATALYTLTWTSSSSDVLIELAGHLAMGMDVSGAGSGIGYGSGYGAGSINGGPYHFKLAKLDGNALGSQDNQIKSADIRTSISCNTSGLGLVCAGSENTYSYNSSQGGLSYTWSLSDNTSGAYIVGSPTGQNVVVNSGSGPGEYTITVNVRDGLQTVMCPYHVTVTGFSVVATPLPILCAGNKTPVTVAATGGAAPYSGTGTFLRHAGTHTFTVTDANGCQSSATVTIMEPSQLVAQASATSVLCGTSMAEVTVSAIGGKPPYKGTGKFNRGVGTHTFNITDANNCIALASVTVRAPSVLNVNVSATTIDCAGDDATVTVSATGGTPPYSGIGTFTRSAGTYTFSVTDANSCTATETVTITEPPLLTIAANASQQIQCYNGTASVVVAASGGTPPYTGEGTFSRSAGAHSFSVTDANGCTASTTVTLTQPSTALSVTAHASSVSCFGGTTAVTVSATGGTPPYTGTGTQQLGVGTHAINVTDANGCTASTSVTISGPTQQLSIAVNAAQVLCNSSTALVTVTASGGTPPYSGTGTFTRSAGTHYFTVTDANNCAVMSAPITISAPPALVASVSAPAIQCNGGSTTVSVSANGGTPPYTGVGNYSAGAGSSTYIVSDVNGCADTVSLTLTEPPLLTVTALAQSVLCYGGTAAVLVSASGGTPPYTGTGTQHRGTGPQVMTVTDANGCSASTTITVAGPTQPLLITVNATPILCNGDVSVVTVSATGGTPPYSGTGTFTRSAGMHGFTVTDAKNCSASKTITLANPSVMTASLNAPAIMCQGGTTTVSVTAAGGSPPYTGTGSFTVGAGSYTYIVSDVNGCSDTLSLTLTDPPLLVAASSATQILCHGSTASVTVTASGGTPPYSGTGTFSHGAGTHTLTVTDANGCTAQTTVTISQPPQFIVTASATPILCNGDQSTVTVTAVGGTPPYTGTGTYTRSAGTYSFTVTDDMNCSVTETITIAEPAQLVVLASAPPILCNGETTTISVTATGGTPPYSGTGNFTVGSGSYTYVVTDANGCSDSASLSLSEPPLVAIGLNATPVRCFGENSTVTVTASGGIPPYAGTGSFSRGAGTHTFAITDANGCPASASITINEPPQLIVNAQAPTLACGRDSALVTVTASGGTPQYSGTGSFYRGLGTWSFTVTDANNCQETVQVTITGPPALYAAANATPILCYGGTTTITVTGWGGTPPYSGVGTFIRGAGTHTFVVVDANNCTDTVEVNITEPPPLAAIADALPIVCNDDSTTVTVTATGGTPPYSGIGSFSRGPGTYTFVVTDANGCSDTTSITLDNPPMLQATVSATPIQCFGEESIVTVMASGGTPPYTGTGTYLRGAGTHHFVVGDSRGCKVTVTITITEPPELAAVATAPPASCSYDSSQIRITASGGTPPYIGTGYFWRSPGTYTFIVTDANGCADTVQATVTAPPALYAAASATPILCHGGTTTITVTAWGGTPPYSGIGTFVRGAGTHTFIITDANGCQDTATVVVVEPPPLEVLCDVSDCINGVRTVTALVNGGTPGYSYLWMPFQTTTPSIDVPCNFSGTITVRVRDANWTSNDPNNSSCEAFCSVTIFSKDQAGGAAAPVAEDNGYELYENYPNPFNPTTTIRYYVPELSHVRLSVINTLGQVITTLVDKEVPGGVHHVTWDANAQYGGTVTSGSYIYRMHAKSLISDTEFVKDRLMLLLR
ncbi:MAG: hypothetical protein C0600_00335 [Ignavibacteria bacterium]|nr:MAG: hypothetical protein C0600_00335 [Ignavibacteria bacterium]